MNPVSALPRDIVCEQDRMSELTRTSVSNLVSKFENAFLQERRTASSVELPRNSSADVKRIVKEIEEAILNKRRSMNVRWSSFKRKGALIAFWDDIWCKYLINCIFLLLFEKNVKPKRK